MATVQACVYWFVDCRALNWPEFWRVGTHSGGFGCGRPVSAVQGDAFDFYSACFWVTMGHLLWCMLPRKSVETLQRLQSTHQISYMNWQWAKSSLILKFSNGLGVKGLIFVILSFWPAGYPEPRKSRFLETKWTQLVVHYLLLFLSLFM